MEALLTVEVEGTGSRVWLPSFTTSPLMVVYFWTIPLTALILDFLFCKMGVMILRTGEGCGKD